MKDDPFGVREDDVRERVILASLSAKMAPGTCVEFSQTLNELAAVAALLHDIGLIAQRAGDPLSPTADHAALAGAFAAERVPTALRIASSAVLAHHHPDDRLSRIVAAADRVAAGGEDDEDPARPMLQRIGALARAAGGKGNAYSDLAPLALDADSLTPRPVPLDRDGIRERLGKLAETFATEHTLASNPDVATYIEGLVELIDRVGSGVPAPSREGPVSVSLADHLRMSAAIAAALAADETSDAELTALAAQEEAAWDAPRLVLVKGDLVGDLDATGDLATARGNAFALDEIARAIADWLVRQTGVTPVNRLYVGNAGFTLLLPLKTASSIAELSGGINARLAATVDGAVWCTLASTSLSAREAGTGCGAAMARLGAKAAAVKGQEIGAMSVATQARLFQARVAIDDDTLATIGANLADAVGVLVSDQPENGGRSTSVFENALASFGRSISLLTPATGLTNLPSGTIRARVERFGAPQPPDSALRAWTQRQAAPVAATSALRPRLLQETTAPLGVLRADIDGLTDLLGHGAETSPSLAAWRGLIVESTRALRGNLDTLLAETAPGVSVISSGGDDVVLAGPLATLPEIAHRLGLGLKNAAALNPAVHLSAGVVPVTDTVGHAVDHAHEAVQRAKARTGKDALAFFDTIVSWEAYQPLFMTYRRFVDLIEKRNVPHTLLAPFITAAARTAEQHGVFGPWLWQAAQQLRALTGVGLPEADYHNFVNDLRRPDGLARLTVAARWASLATRSAEESL